MRRRGLAEIVHQGRKADFRVRGQQHRLIQHHQSVTPVSISGCHFPLRHAEQALISGKDDLQRAAFAQPPRKTAGAGFAQGLLVSCRHVATKASTSPCSPAAHQRHCFGSHLKSQRREAGGEAREPQTRTGSSTNAGDTCPQYACLQIALPAVAGRRRTHRRLAQWR